MKPEYQVGTRVRDRYDRDYLGTVVEVVDEDEIHVKWDGEPEEISRLDPYEIAPYDPEEDKRRAIRAQNKVNEATSALETAFRLWQEAQEEYSGDAEHGTEYAYDMKRDPNMDLSKFEEVVEANGWSTSSLYC